ncbi:putative DNA-binding protein [Mycolicibacterium hippocampi]|uniref:Putative DNA-binding protein n=1 Tax=Mycolicibacterium hippocampi TaxID=659824 RepID=A0A850Q1F7_9MYCO|nr:putative DNA-binding protein [Mycolicibacterium hippocampi]
MLSLIRHDHQHVVSDGIDLADVARLLRARRRALQPEDVGMPRGRRRRTPGLRREEVAALCSMSTAYYSRLERRRVDRHCGPRPSPTMIASIARGLRFSSADRDRLFSAAGYREADRIDVIAHIEPGLMHVLDRLADTPALAVDPIGRVLHQTPTAAYLFGEQMYHTGWARSSYYRWFTDPAERQHFAAGEQSTIGAEITADLRRSVGLNPSRRAAGDLVSALLDRSGEFAELWRTRPATNAVAARQCGIVHPELGLLELQREVLCDNTSGQRLVLYLATPGSEGHVGLTLASVIGYQRFDR